MKSQDAEVRDRTIEAEETAKLHEENLLLKDEVQKLKQSLLDQEKEIESLRSRVGGIVKFDSAKATS